MFEKSIGNLLVMMDNEIEVDNSIDIENFTQDLHNHCRLYRSKLDDWVDGQMTSCNAAVERHNSSAAIHQGRIDQTMQTLLAWQLQDGLTINDNDCNNNSNHNNNEKKRETLRQKQLQVQDELDGLQVQLDQKKTHLQDLKLQEQQANTRVAQARDASKHVHSLKQAKIDELTKGINNYYKYLGLEFEKAENEQLRCSFTQLDPDDPERRFSFNLSTNEQDDFVVKVLTLNNNNTSTRSPGEQDDDDGGGDNGGIFEPVIQALKEKEDLAAFVRDMRKAFLHQLHVIRSMTTTSNSSHSSPTGTRTDEY